VAGIPSGLSLTPPHETTTTTKKNLEELRKCGGRGRERERKK
jgi:hypothetical protein